MMNDFWMFDPESTIWTSLSDMVDGPASRSVSSHGFASLNGRLYVHAGQNDSGDPEVFWGIKVCTKMKMKS